MELRVECHPTEFVPDPGMCVVTVVAELNRGRDLARSPSRAVLIVHPSVLLRMPFEGARTRELGFADCERVLRYLRGKRPLWDPTELALPPGLTCRMWIGDERLVEVPIPVAEQARASGSALTYEWLERELAFATEETSLEAVLGREVAAAGGHRLLVCAVGPFSERARAALRSHEERREVRLLCEEPVAGQTLTDQLLRLMRTGRSGSVSQSRVTWTPATSARLVSAWHVGDRKVTALEPPGTSDAQVEWPLGTLRSEEWVILEVAFSAESGSGALSLGRISCSADGQTASGEVVVQLAEHARPAPCDKVPGWRHIPALRAAKGGSVCWGMLFAFLDGHGVSELTRPDPRSPRLPPVGPSSCRCKHCKDALPQGAWWCPNCLSVCEEPARPGPRDLCPPATGGKSEARTPVEDTVTVGFTPAQVELVCHRRRPLEVTFSVEGPADTAALQFRPSNPRVEARVVAVSAAQVTLRLRWLGRRAPEAGETCRVSVTGGEPLTDDIEVVLVPVRPAWFRVLFGRRLGGPGVRRGA